MTNPYPYSHQNLEARDAPGQNVFQQGASWVANEAAAAYSASASAVIGGSRVADTFLTGAYNQVMQHPFETGAEIVGGAVAVAVGAQTGIGVVTVGAVTAGLAAVGLAAYAGDIALTEGPAAVPEHMQKAFDQVRDMATSTASAIAEVYNGNKNDPAFAQSQERIEQLGADSVPIAAATLGGTGYWAGRMALAAAAGEGGAIAGGAIAAMSTPAQMLAQDLSTPFTNGLSASNTVPGTGMPFHINVRPGAFVGRSE